MRPRFLLFAAMACGLAIHAHAELQNVEVGGGIRIRGNWYDLDHTANESAWIEQRTRLNVKADFTDNVTAFIEVDSYGNWGSEFRSDYLTGFDSAGGADLDLYQAYIEANEMWGTPLRLRIGRQELSFGSQWLVGVNDASSLFRGLSFDAIRADYKTDMFTVTGFLSKLVETQQDFFSESDVDFYGLYASYTGMEDMTIDAYWFYLHDDGGRNANLTTDIHTVGLRAGGKINAFDYEAEAAYQFGSLDGPNGNDPDYGQLAGNLEVGYTFDASIQPRIYVGGAYLGGDANTFRHHGGSGELSFNRLFSNWEYSEFLDNPSNFSNVWLARAGASIMPTESVKLTLAATYFKVLDTVSYGHLWWKQETDDTLGWEVGLYGNYQYTEDLAFRAGFVHFFGDDGLRGNKIIGNGLLAYPGNAGDDYNYAFVETEIKF